MSRTMLETKIDKDEQVVLHDQVAAEIRKAIAGGEVIDAVSRSAA